MQNHRPRKQAVRHLEEKILRWEWMEPTVTVDAALAAETPLPGAGEDGDAEPEVIHTERYPVKPMFVDEAVLQMEMSAKQFLVFLNAKTDKVNVLYRRKSGDFGLIEPMFNT
jgi:putative sigma-54 modulation protein